MLPRFIFLVFLLLIATTAHVGADPLVRPRTRSDAKESTDLPPLVYTAAQSYDPLAWLHGQDRFGSGTAHVGADAFVRPPSEAKASVDVFTTAFLSDESGRRPLVPQFAYSADPAVSFDGERILFAGKQHPGDPWQIWQVSRTGGDLRRITSGAEDCIRPLYLPDDRVVYARKVAGRFAIEVMNLSGGNPLALTYGPANALPTAILRDGRILFEAGYPLGTGSTPEIYTVYSDGSGVESYRCDHGNARRAGTQTGSGDIVFASTKGLARFTSARAQEIPVAAPAGEYDGGIVETSSGSWLMPWRASGGARFELKSWAAGSPALKTELATSEFHLLEPALLAPHAVPNRHPSGLHDWPNANLLCLNAYTSKYSFAPGSIHSVQVYTRDAVGNSKLLGTAPVERDGSFFVQVPTEQPLQIALLDATGKTLKREAGYFWMRRGEQRGCVGCHAGPETSPENAVPMILLKSTTPTDMTGSATSATGGH